MNIKINIRIKYFNSVVITPNKHDRVTQITPIRSVIMTVFYSFTEQNHCGAKT